MLPTYLDYTAYFGDLAKIPESAFDLFLHRSVMEINRYITTKIEELSSKEALLCIMEVADLLHTVLERDGILSENTDGYSVTYGDNTVTVYSIVKRCLGDYLYRGVEL